MSWAETIYLKNYIRNSKALYASDDLYATIFEKYDIVFEGAGEKTYPLPIKLKMINNGSMKLYTQIETGYTGMSGYFKIFKNDIEIFKGDVEESQSSTVRTFDIEATVVFEPNDVFTFEYYGKFIYPQNAGLSFSNLEVRGTVVDNIMILKNK